MFESECPMGYPLDELRVHMGAVPFLHLSQWLTGQTMMLCDGQRYDHDLGSYVKGCDVAHGPVVYAWDYKRWIEGGPIID